MEVLILQLSENQFRFIPISSCFETLAMVLANSCLVTYENRKDICRAVSCIALEAAPVP